MFETYPIKNSFFVFKIAAGKKSVRYLYMYNTQPLRHPPPPPHGMNMVLVLSLMGEGGGKAENRAQSLFLALGALVRPGVNFWAHCRNFRRTASNTTYTKNT